MADRQQKQADATRAEKQARLEEGEALKNAHLQTTHSSAVALLQAKAVAREASLLHQASEKQRKWEAFQANWSRVQHQAWEKEVAKFRQLQAKQTELAKELARRRKGVEVQTLGGPLSDAIMSGSNSKAEEKTASSSDGRLDLLEAMISPDSPRSYIVQIPGASSLIRSNLPLQPLKGTEFGLGEQVSQPSQQPRHAAHKASEEWFDESEVSLDDPAADSSSSLFSSAAIHGPPAVGGEDQYWHQPVEEGPVRKDLAAIFGVKPTALGGAVSGHVPSSSIIISEELLDSIAQKTYVFPRAPETAAATGPGGEMNAEMREKHDAHTREVAALLEQARLEAHRTRQVKKQQQQAELASQQNEEKQQSSEPQSHSNHAVSPSKKRGRHRPAGYLAPMMSSPSDGATADYPQQYPSIEDALEVRRTAQVHKPQSKIASARSDASLVASLTKSLESTRSETQEEKEPQGSNRVVDPIESPPSSFLPFHRLCRSLRSPGGFRPPDALHGAGRAPDVGVRPRPGPAGHGEQARGGAGHRGEERPAEEEQAEGGDPSEGAGHPRRTERT